MLNQNQYFEDDIMQGSTVVYASPFEIMALHYPVQVHKKDYVCIKHTQHNKQ